MDIQRFAENARKVSGRRRRHGLSGALGRLGVGHGALVLDCCKEVASLVMSWLDLENDSEDPDGS